MSNYCCCFDNKSIERLLRSEKCDFAILLMNKIYFPYIVIKTGVLFSKEAYSSIHQIHHLYKL